MEAEGQNVDLKAIEFNENEKPESHVSMRTAGDSKVMSDSEIEDSYKFRVGI